MVIKTIVVGVDLGESGHRAMQLAVPTAQATRATLWLVHASEVGLEHAWRDLPLGARSAAQALRERLKGRFENSLQELESERQRCEDLGLSCQSSCDLADRVCGATSNDDATLAPGILLFAERH